MFDPMVCRPGIPALGVVLGAAALAQACAGPQEQRSTAAASTVAGECRQRILLTFALPSEPEVVNALAASAAVKLDVVSHPLPTTYVLDLATTDCATAVQKLRNDPEGKTTQINLHQLGQRLLTSERELALMNHVRRRLAYLVNDESLYAAIDRIEFKENVGKLMVFYANERRGRLFDYIEGGEGFDKFIFPSPYGEIVTKSVLDIDEALQATFTARVRELGHLQSVERLARSA